MPNILNDPRSRTSKRLRTVIVLFVIDLCKTKSLSHETWTKSIENEVNEKRH